jgi:hypothetical protein
MTHPTHTKAASTIVPGLVPDTRLTEAYARMVACEAYFWAWPMVNVYNRRLALRFHKVACHRKRVSGRSHCTTNTTSFPRTP